MEPVPPHPHHAPQEISRQPHTPVQAVLPGCVQTEFGGSEHAPGDAKPGIVQAAEGPLWG